jgi:hypothetical protein
MRMQTPDLLLESKYQGFSYSLIMEILRIQLEERLPVLIVPVALPSCGIRIRPLNKATSE